MADTADAAAAAADGSGWLTISARTGMTWTAVVVVVVVAEVAVVAVGCEIRRQLMTTMMMMIRRFSSAARARSRRVERLSLLWPSECRRSRWLQLMVWRC